MSSQKQQSGDHNPKVVPERLSGPQIESGVTEKTGKVVCLIKSGVTGKRSRHSRRSEALAVSRQVLFATASPCTAVKEDNNRCARIDGCGRVDIELVLVIIAIGDVF